MGVPTAKFRVLLILLALLLVLSVLYFLNPKNKGQWIRHTIDKSSRGADGVKLGDVNKDGWADIVTGWEQGGLVRLYLNPGPDKSKQAWTAITVGTVPSPEDAVIFDVDANGIADVISACEGKVRSIFFHKSPVISSQYLDSKSWTTSPLSESQDTRQWMFLAPAQIDGQRGIDLAAGSKNNRAEIGWFESPEHPQDSSEWKWHSVAPAGWVMSLLTRDMDLDGDMDMLVSDRTGNSSGVFWLENPGPGNLQSEPWKKHWIGARDMTVMFINETDLDRDGKMDVIAAVRKKQLLFFRRENSGGTSWREYAIEIPEEAGEAKAVTGGDINLDGQVDLVFSCEHSKNKSGVMWLEYSRTPEESRWKSHDISGLEGVKFDLVELIDLDGDRDLDVLTTEEVSNLGVIWYENPTR